MVKPGKTCRIVGLVIHVLIGALLIFAGVMKLAGMVPPEAKEKMAAGIANNLMLIGAGELITGILLIVPLTSSLGLLLATGFWGGVICTQMADGGNFLAFSGFLLLTWVGGYLRDPSVLNSFTKCKPKEPVPASEG